MKSPNPGLRKFVSVAEAIARLLHPHAEVVVHDVRSNRIAAIFNGFSLRHVGDDSLIEDAESLKSAPDLHGPFPKRLFDGRRLKYVTSLLRDDSGQVIGLMCVNLDLSAFETLVTSLQGLLATGGDSTRLDQLFNDDWQERIDVFVRRYLPEKSLSLKDLRRAERALLVRALHNAGAFRARGAATYVARVLGVSRATVYSDLAAIAANDSTP